MSLSYHQSSSSHDISWYFTSITPPPVFQEALPSASRASRASRPRPQDPGTNLCPGWSPVASALEHGRGHKMGAKNLWQNLAFRTWEFCIYSKVYSLCHSSEFYFDGFLSESLKYRGPPNGQTVGAAHSLMRPRPVGHGGIFLAKQIWHFSEGSVYALGIGAKHTISDYIMRISMIMAIHGENKKQQVLL